MRTVAFVTGAGRGIGQTIALRLAKDGMRVAISARSADQLVDTVALSGGEILAFAGDVTDPARVEAMFRETERSWGAGRSEAKRLKTVNALLGHLQLASLDLIYPSLGLWRTTWEKIKTASGLSTWTVGPSLRTTEWGKFCERIRTK